MPVARIGQANQCTQQPAGGLQLTQDATPLRDKGLRYPESILCKRCRCALGLRAAKERIARAVDQQNGDRPGHPARFESEQIVPAALGPFLSAREQTAAQRFVDMRGRPDLFGRALQVTETGFADEIAAAAGLLMGQADEAVPMVLVRGLGWTAPELAAAALIRPAEHDLFR